MHASGVPAVEHINHGRGPAHGKAVWLPWPTVSKEDRSCFASNFWTAIIGLPDTPAIPGVGDSIDIASFFDLWPV